MSTVVACLAIIAMALMVVVTIAFLDRDRDRQSRLALMGAAAARMEDLDAFRSTTQSMVVAFANTLTTLVARDTDQQAAVLNALTSDRDRLLTALLATSHEPQAARTLGMVDQAKARESNAMSMREFLEEHAANRVDTEFTTGDGVPIVPVGMSGS